MSKQDETFDLDEAVRRLSNGKAVRRKSNKPYPVNTCRMFDGDNALYDADGFAFEFHIDDFKATDWIEVKIVE